MRRLTLLLLSMLVAAPAAAEFTLLRPARVFDGVNPSPLEGWSVLVDGDRIVAAGATVTAPTGARTADPARPIGCTRSPPQGVQLPRRHDATKTISRKRRRTARTTRLARAKPERGHGRGGSHDRRHGEAQHRIARPLIGWRALPHAN